MCTLVVEANFELVHRASCKNTCESIQQQIQNIDYKSNYHD